ncbi:unnamed protein product [Nezara viridula]|uniref:RBR-type E3 ubiquitin transferase n=2 Tax=Nezara viridula TaxID=85310 RepID=A0A9P0E7M8_NEZVI|nr:unnamed protein product [Nezara viridula]
MPQWITARGTAVPPPPPPPQDDLPPLEPEYEVIEFSGQQTYSNQPIIRGKELRERKRCDLCGSSAPAVRCLQCVQQNFCYSCDEMYHRHPKRQFHTRKELEGGGLPPLPPKGEPQPPPVPPPRRNKRATPRPQHSPQPPPIPPSPQISQREQLHPKQGLMGSLKRMIGGRQLPIVPHGIEHQNQMPVNNSMMKFHDSAMNCNGCQDWLEFQRGPRSGSFSNLNPPNFGLMMQSQSMAHLNCPSCQKQPMWNPWNGMPAAGTWQSSAFLNRYPPREEWSDSDSEFGGHKERQRRFSTLSAKTPKSYGYDDTHSVRGGRRTDAETSSNKGNRRKDFETMSNYGGSRRNRTGSMSLRGSRRSDLENSLPRSQKRLNDVQRNKCYDDDSDGRIKDSETSDIESDDDFVAKKSTRKIMSDVEDMHMSRKKSEPLIAKSNISDGSRSVKSQSKRNEDFTDIGRKPSSFIKTPSIPRDGIQDNIKNARQTESEHEDDLINGIELRKADEEDLGPIPDTEWECKHCTFINQGGTRVCTVCCKTTAKPKLCKTTSPPSGDFMKKLIIEDKQPNEPLPKNPTKELKEKRGISESNRNLASKGTSPPPQSISTQTYEEAGRKLKRATSLADYGNWRTPQRSTSKQSLLSDTQSLPVTPPRSLSPEQKKNDALRRSSDQFSQRSIRRAGSQPPEYISSLVQKQVKQGLEMVKLLREAEEHQFSADDLAIALLHCGDGDPINWLQENWRNMIDTVVTLGTNYGQERKENIVGTISASEAREALRIHNGNVWAAVTECVEQRQRKYAELLSRGNFSREDIVTVLTANHGNLEEAYKELNKNQLKPFLMRIWGPPQGADNDDGDITKLAHGELDGQGDKNSEEVSVDLSIESNFDRIQNWLDHVNINNKARFSQSMLQLNLNRGNALEPESKFQVNNLDFSGKHQTSDIHRYLTNFYNANEKSLRIGTKSMYSSENNLSMTVQRNEDNLHHPKQIQSSSINNESNNGHLINEIETVTIKLKPIVVGINDDQTDDSDSNEGENMIFNTKNEIGSDVLSRSSGESKRDTKPIISNPKSDIDMPFSNNKHLILSRSESETSSESFESLHSSSSENQNIYQNTAANILENETSSSNDIYENIQIIHTDKEQKEIETHQHVSKTNDEINNCNQSNIQMTASDPLIKSQSDNLQSNGKIDSKLFSNERLNKQREKIVQPIVSEGSDNSDNYSIEEIIPDNNEKKLVRESNTIENAVRMTTSQSSTSSLYEENESNNESNGAFIPKQEQVLQERNITVTSNITSKVKETSKNTIKNYHNQKTSKTISKNSYPSKTNSTSSKSDYDINECESNEFSEESNDFIDQNDLPVQVITIKRNQISEENNNSIMPNQDIDQVAISEKNDIKTNTENNPRNNLYNYDQTELIDILKHNLTKDDVVEKIVHTLFASVLRASAETRRERDIELVNKMVNEKKIEPEETSDLLTRVGDLNYLQNSDVAEKRLLSNQEVERNVTAIAAEENTSKETYSNIDNNETKIDDKLKRLNKEIYFPVDALVGEKKTLDDIGLNNDNNETEIEENLIIQNEEMYTPVLPSDGEEKTLEEIFSTKTEIGEKVQKKIEIIFDSAVALNEENDTSEEMCFINDNKKAEIEEKLQIKSDGKYDPVASLSAEQDTTLVEICYNNDNKETQVDEILEMEGVGIKDPVVPLFEKEEIQKEIYSSNDNKNKLETIFNNESEFQGQDDSNNILMEREARRLLAEGLVATYQQAEIALQLKELNLDEDDGAILAAANDCVSLESAIAFLQQECQLCAGKYSVKQMISMLECEHRCCLECANNYFTLQITERSINDCTCPFCNEPDIFQLEEEKVLTYFSNLDILLKGLVKENVHELFQRKLRDRTLMQDPNFKWCIKCSSGYIANPRQKRLMCPDCKAVTCAKCMKPWEKEHETMSCEEYQAWLQENDPENQLAQHLDENGVTCPNCKSKYLLAKGGCMHLICPHCKHEFCSGCSKPFLMGKKCSLSEYCEKLGLHSHHPRNCLFYLRDKEPEQLEKLLEDNNINFKKEEIIENKRCNIQLLKETSEGLIEAICGFTTVKAGLCRTHYVESLVTAIRNNNIDPVVLLDYGESLQELKRHGKEPPERPTGMSEYHHWQNCLKIIADEIPLD